MKKMVSYLFITLIIFNFSVNAQLKGDPWIFQAYKELYGRSPNAWELNIKNYNSGSWNNYGELKNYITQYQTALRNQGLTVTTYDLKDGKVAAVFNQNGKAIAADVISPDGGFVIAPGGGNVIAAGGLNLIGAAAGNLAGVSFGGKYTTQSAGTKIIPVSGNGALIIK